MSGAIQLVTRVGQWVELYIRSLGWSSGWNYTLGQWVEQWVDLYSR